MATYDLTNLNTGLKQFVNQGQAASVVSTGKIQVVSAVVDLEDLSNYKYAASGPNLVATDVIKVLRIPSGSLILGVVARVIRAAVASSTETITLTLAGDPTTNFITGSTVKDFVPLSSGTAVAVKAGTVFTLGTAWIPGAEDSKLKLTIGTLSATPTDYGKYEFAVALVHLGKNYETSACVAVD